MKKIAMLLLLIATARGQSLTFDGTNDYVSVSNNIAGTYSAFTISSWVKIDDYGDNNPDFIVDVGSSGNGTRINLSISSTGFNASLEGTSSNIFDVNASSSNTTSRPPNPNPKFPNYNPKCNRSYVINCLFVSTVDCFHCFHSPT